MSSLGVVTMHFQCLLVFLDVIMSYTLRCDITCLQAIRLCGGHHTMGCINSKDTQVGLGVYTASRCWLLVIGPKLIFRVQGLNAMFHLRGRTMGIDSKYMSTLPCQCDALKNSPNKAYGMGRQWMIMDQCFGSYAEMALHDSAIVLLLPYCTSPIWIPLVLAVPSQSQSCMTETTGAWPKFHEQWNKMSASRLRHWLPSSVPALCCAQPPTASLKPCYCARRAIHAWPNTSCNYVTHQWFPSEWNGRLRFHWVLCAARPRRHWLELPVVNQDIDPDVWNA